MSIFNLDLDGLSYYTTKIKQYIEDKILNKVDKVSGKGLSTNDLTNTLKNNYDSAYTHSTTDHAPSNAQANVIETIKVNGTALTPSSKAVDITVPSVGNGTVTIKQAGVSKGTFTMNQSGNTTIELTDNNTTYGVATQSANGLMSLTDKSKLDYTNIAFCTCDTAAATAAKVVTLSDNTNWTLKVGAIIVVKFTNTNTASSVTLNVNGTGAKSIWYNQSVYTSNWNIITGYANRPLMYMYDGTYWVWISQSGDNDTQDRTRFAQTIKCGTNAIVAGNIIVGKDGVYSHLKLGNAFDITYPILYAVSSISASSTGTNNYLVIPLTITTTQSITLTAYKPVYIKGNLSGTTFTPISTTPLTQTVPTSADGYEYILLGVAYSTTGIYLLADHPIFAYKGGAFGQISSKGITDLSVSGKTITYTRGDGSTGTITTQDTTYGVATSSTPGLVKSGADIEIDDSGLVNVLYAYNSQTAIELVDTSGNLLDVGSVNTPVYFNGGIPEACTSLSLNTTGSAAKLSNTSAIGSATKPVYFSADGVPVAGTYTLGAACAKGVTDSSSAGALSTGTNLVTERDVYHGTPKINGVKTYNSNTSIYAPTSVGTSGQVLKSSGNGAPVWGSVDVTGITQMDTIIINSGTSVELVTDSGSNSDITANGSPIMTSANFVLDGTTLNITTN